MFSLNTFKKRRVFVLNYVFANVFLFKNKSKSIFSQDSLRCIMEFCAVREREREQKKKKSGMNFCAKSITNRRIGRYKYDGRAIRNNINRQRRKTVVTVVSITHACTCIVLKYSCESFAEFATFFFIKIPVIVFFRVRLIRIIPPKHTM